MGSDHLRAWAGTLLILGASAALLAFGTGSGAIGGALDVPQPTRVQIEAHNQWAGSAIWPLAGSGLLRGVWRKRLQGAHGWATLMAEVLSAALLLVVSASGTAIAHDDHETW